jgi:hypothetical protein
VFPLIAGGSPAAEQTPIITATEPVPVPAAEEQVARIKASKAKSRVLPAIVTATEPSEPEPEAPVAEPTAAAGTIAAAPEPAPATPELALVSALARGVTSAALVTAINKLKPAPAAKPAANRGFYTDDMMIKILQPGKTVPGRPGLGGYARIAVYTNPDCKTVGDFLRIGAAQNITSAGRKDLNWDVLVGNISVSKPPNPACQ